MPYKDPETRKLYNRRYTREYRARRRAKYMAGKECQACGSTEDLEIHHRDPAEKDDHRIWTWSAERLERELEKCDILCYDCHRGPNSVVHRIPPEEDEAVQAEILKNLSIMFR